MNFASWRQTRINTCGPACLMVALSELGRSDISEETEMRIWRRVRHMLVLGSTPAALASYARARGARAELLVYGPRPADFPLQVSGLHLFLQRYLLYAYRLGARAAARNGVPVVRASGGGEILDRITIRPETRAIVLIVDRDRILHFLLVRKNGPNLMVMDPDSGANIPFSRPAFLALEKASGVGYCVLVS
ncbi:MAG: peptidase C39 family protein [Thermodesulfobacteriota bacterium]